VNPYAPVQGPGIWLLLPLVGLVLAWKGRKKGPGRMVVLVVVVGMGMTLLGCGETQPPPNGPTPPTLPNTPSPVSTDLVEPTPSISDPDRELLARTVEIQRWDNSVECPSDHPNVPPEDITIGNPIGDSSLGTIIRNGRAVLTHDHYDSIGLNQDKIDFIRFINYQNDSIDVSLDEMNFPKGDGGGTRIFEFKTLSLTTELVGSKSAELGNPEELVVGQEVQQVYRGGYGNPFQVRHAKVIEVDKLLPPPANVLGFVIESPGSITKPGDSGGGVFLEGKLIGNTAQATAEEAQIAELPISLR
jgi:hypothetical protein